MAQKKSNVPEGYEVVQSKLTFISLEKGDSLHGIFRGVRESYSKQYEKKMVNWTVELLAPTKDRNGEIIPVGEIVGLGEKTVLNSLRLKLSPGQEFFLVCLGQEKGSKGRQGYFNYELYVNNNEIPF